MKYLSNINLLQNELQNARIQNLATAPSSPVKGQIYYNTVSNELVVYNGTAWEVVGKEYDGGTYITVDGTTINHDDTTRSDTTSSASPAYGGTFTVVDSVTTNATGHITAINVKTITMPAQYVHPSYDGDDIDIDTGALTGATVISDLDFNVTTDASGHVTDANATVATRTLTLGDLGFTGDADANNKVYDILAVTTTGGALLRLNDSDSVTDDVKFASGTEVGVAFTDANTITINHADVSRSDSTSSASPAFGDTFDVISSVTSNARGHITAVDVKTITLPAAGADKFASAYSWTGGTTAGPTGTLTITNGTDVSFGAIPAASASASGIVTTGAQNFAGNKTFDNNVTIEGDLVVNGNTTTVATQTLAVEDYIIEIAKDNSVALASYAGFVIPNYDGTNDGALIIDSAGEFRIGDVSYSGNTITDVASQPVLTREETGTLVDGEILIWNATGAKAIGGGSLQDLGGVKKYSGTITGDNSTTDFTVANATHGIGNKYMTIAVYETSSGEQVFVNTVINQSTFAVTFSFAVAPATSKTYEFVLIG